MSTNIQLVIFDLDGVLVDTNDIHTLALRDAIKLFLDNVPSYIDSADGIRTADKLKRLQDERGLSNKVIAEISNTKHVYTRHMLNMMALRSPPQLRSWLNGLQAAKIKLALASNSRREYVNIVMRKLGIVGMFNVTLSGDEVSQPKPDPEIFIKCMDLVGVSAQHTVIFEDSEAGLQAARATAARVIRVDAQKLLSENPLEIIS